MNPFDEQTVHNDDADDETLTTSTAICPFM